MKVETNPRMAWIAYYTETTNLLEKRAVMKRTAARSAINGRFVTQEYAKKHPKTTVKELHDPNTDTVRKRLARCKLPER
jgi:hypothetical protein